MARHLTGSDACTVVAFNGVLCSLKIVEVGRDANKVATSHVKSGIYLNSRPSSRLAGGFSCPLLCYDVTGCKMPTLVDYSM